MFLTNIINHIKVLFNHHDEKEWLDRLVINLERQKKRNNTLYFTIVDIKKKGFKVKICGLYGYVAFNHMPWRYKNTQRWIAIAPTLMDKRFDCKIYQIYRNPLHVVADGNIPQFESPPLVRGKKYMAVVIAKSNLGWHLDLGYHFDWMYGSIETFLTKTEFSYYLSDHNTDVGDEMPVTYCGLDHNKQHKVSSNEANIGWLAGGMENLIGKVLWIRIFKIQGKKRAYLIKGRYKGIVTIRYNDYPRELRKTIDTILSELVHDDIIQGRIVAVNAYNQTMVFEWLPELKILSKTNIEVNRGMKVSLQPEPVGLVQSKTKLILVPEPKSKPQPQNQIKSTIHPATLQKLEAIRQELELMDPRLVESCFAKMKK